MINPIRWLITKIRHYRYCRYQMYGNRASRRGDRKNEKERS